MTISQIADQLQSLVSQLEVEDAHNSALLFLQRGLDTLRDQKTQFTEAPDAYHIRYFFNNGKDYLDVVLPVCDELDDYLLSYSRRKSRPELNKVIADFTATHTVRNGSGVAPSTPEQVRQALDDSDVVSYCNFRGDADALMSAKASALYPFGRRVCVVDDRASGSHGECYRIVRTINVYSKEEMEFDHPTPTMAVSTIQECLAPPVREQAKLDAQQSVVDIQKIIFEAAQNLRQRQSDLSPAVYAEWH